LSAAEDLPCEAALMISPNLVHNTSQIWSCWAYPSSNIYPKCKLDQKIWKTVLLVVFVHRLRKS